MVTFRNNNNNRRTNFRRNDRIYKRNGESAKFGSNFSNGEKFQRKIPGRNNHNAAKLIEKYNNLAREALSSGDRILSENYFQHADHFTRIVRDQENYKKNKIVNNYQAEDNLHKEDDNKITKEGVIEQKKEKKDDLNESQSDKINLTP